MTLRWKIFAILCFLVTVYIGGLLVFTRGFLLSRLVIEKNSTCTVDFASHTDHHGGEGCWMHKRYNKAIIIVIDALRFDFTTYNTSLSMSNAAPYQNKLPLIHELLTTKSMNSRLYKFIADPPTTTLQRLKGLTTGSLPTFVDAGSNFASSEIQEDNFIDQLRGLGKRLVFMGDDTWEGLFPSRFRRSYPFSSFNVKDLHTVDDGVIKHLLPEVKRSDWDLLIGHFLGVDHCGHRFGPDHPAMAKKLTQMNGILRSLIKSMTEDTVLFVLGDHGMTRTGDHGGDSVDEVEAALFVYSPSQITASPPQNGKFDTISQIDLVPTLSLLLGAPIPHSNLGTVITDLFNHCPWWKTANNRVKQVFHSVKALHLNAHQVLDYLKSYSKISPDFPHKRFLEADQIFRETETDLQQLVTELYMNQNSEANVLRRLIMLENKYLQVLNQVKTQCKEIWAKFDLNTIVLGVVLTAAILVSSVFILRNISCDVQDLPSHVVICCAGLIWLCVSFVVISVLDMGTMGFVFSLVSALAAVLLIVTVLLKAFSESNNETDAQAVETSVPPLNTCSLTSIFSLCIVVMYYASSFSNSFVVNEDVSSSFLLQSLIVVYFVTLYQTVSMNSPQQRKSKGQTFDLLQHMTSTKMGLLASALTLMTFIRLAQNFQACREEQWSCDVSLFILPLSGLVEAWAGYKNMRYCISVISIITITLIAYYWMKRNGNLMGLSPSIFCVKYVIPLSCTSMCLYWALQGLPQQVLDSIPVWQQVAFPQICYLCILVTMTAVVYKPMCINFIPCPKGGQQSFNSVTASESITSMYKHLKLNWKQHFQKRSSSEENPPTVYGLGTVYSTSLIVLLVAMQQLLCLLLGDGLAPGLVLGILSAILLLELHAHHTILLGGDTSDVPISAIVAWFLLGQHFFYGTGHQTTMPNIRWDAAFVGFHGDWNNKVLPGVLMFLNTFASQVFFALSLPLLLIWPTSRRKAILNLHNQKSSDSPLQEMELHQKGDKINVAMFKSTLTYIVLCCAKVFSSMCAAGLLRRHLMVWKIFAPRFVFDGACSIVTCVVLLLVNLFINRVQTVVNTWMKTLEKPSEVS